MLSLQPQIWHMLWVRSSLNFRQTTECRFTMKLIHHIIITYSQMNCTDNYSQHSSVIWPIWPYGWVFIYRLSGCRFESHFFVLSNNFIVSGICNSSLYPSSILNTNLLLILLMYAWIGGIGGIVQNVSRFLMI